MTDSGSRQSLAALVEESTPWYQTLKLPGGVLTPGGFDTVAELERVPFPASLEGKRCLDVGTAEGFWAYEMERRGASEVVAVDVDRASRYDLPGDAAKGPCLDGERIHLRSKFDLAHAALGSDVRRRNLTVYELDPDTIGRFDFVFMGSLLLHLKDPVGALTAICGVLCGELLSVDAVSPPLTVLHPAQPIARLEASVVPVWWVMNLQAYRHLFGAAGLEIVAAGRPFWVKQGHGYRQSTMLKRSPYQWIRRAALSKLGVLHAWVRAQPLARPR